jgi:hypothetical protein
MRRIITREGAACAPHRALHVPPPQPLSHLEKCGRQHKIKEATCRINRGRNGLSGCDIVRQRLLEGCVAYTDVLGVRGGWGRRAAIAGRSTCIAQTQRKASTFFNKARERGGGGRVHTRG